MPRRKDDPTPALGAMFGERVLVEPRGNKFIVTKLNPRRRLKSSAAQKERQEKFADAVTHAKAVLKDPKKKKFYERNLKGHRNAFQAVVAEYMKKKS
jgi:hypothetical protein